MWVGCAKDGIVDTKPWESGFLSFALPLSYLTGTDELMDRVFQQGENEGQKPGRFSAQPRVPGVVIYYRNPITCNAVPFIVQRSYFGHNRLQTCRIQCGNVVWSMEKEKGEDWHQWNACVVMLCDESGSDEVHRQSCNGMYYLFFHSKAWEQNCSCVLNRDAALSGLVWEASCWKCIYERSSVCDCEGLSIVFCVYLRESERLWYKSTGYVDYVCCFQSVEVHQIPLYLEGM